MRRARLGLLGISLLATLAMVGGSAQAMLEQLSTAVLLSAHYTDSGEGKTGLGDVTCTVYNPARAKIVDAAAATEVGDGFYEYTLGAGSTGTVGEYRFVFKTASADVDQKHLPGQITIGRAGIEYLDAAVSSRASATYYTSTRAAKLDLIGSGSVTYTSIVPENTSEPIEILIGDDYLDADGLALTWNATGLPSFTGGSAKLTIFRNGVKTVYSGSVADADTLKVELTDTQTSALAEGTYAYDLVVKTAGGDFVTVARGWLKAITRLTVAW